MLAPIAIFGFLGLVFGGLWVRALERGKQRRTGRYARYGRLLCPEPSGDSYWPIIRTMNGIRLRGSVNRRVAYVSRDDRKAIESL